MPRKQRFKPSRKPKAIVTTPASSGPVGQGSPSAPGPIVEKQPAVIDELNSTSDDVSSSHDERAGTSDSVA